MDYALEIQTLLMEIESDFNPPLSSTMDIAEYSRKLYKNATIFSVHDSGQLVALMAVYCNNTVDNIAFGTMLAVAKSHRIYGLGPNLIKTTIDYLKKRSFKAFKLEIYKTNPRVITLYKHLKFSVVSETDKSVFVQLDLI
ncbi:MAG: GNAT family N-acetyltransferase [Desulfuromonadaceae bacterium]|nr:GNAT family N-acetyltransferase [Desulfuromonadaceae bacterium]